MNFIVLSFFLARNDELHCNNVFIKAWFIWFTRNKVVFQQETITLIQAGLMAQQMVAYVSKINEWKQDFDYPKNYKT